jgi:metal-responsive CopG/Arc/MetJ family transcriptional regulator
MKLIVSKGDRRRRENLKPKVVSSKLSEEELQDLDLNARQNGISRSQWIRLAIVNSIEKQNSQEAA